MSARECSFLSDAACAYQYDKEKFVRKKCAQLPSYNNSENFKTCDVTSPLKWSPRT